MESQSVKKEMLNCREHQDSDTESETNSDKKRLFTKIKKFESYNKRFRINGREIIIKR